MLKHQKKWTPEEDTRLKEYCANGSLSFREMSVLFNRSLDSVASHASWLGIGSNYVQPNLYARNETFWSVPNMINSYYAGIVASDGSVDWERNGWFWALQEKDKCYLEEFAKHSKYTGKIGFQEKWGYGKNKSRQNYLHVYGASKWNADLHKNFNIVPIKATRLLPPSLSSDLLRCCFIIGVIDGDGSVCFTSKTETINITSSSRALIEWIRDFTCAHFDFRAPRSGNRYPRVNEVRDGYYAFAVNGLKAIKLFDFLRRIDVPHFVRKWNNPAFLTLVETYRQKWPEFFAPDKELAFDPAGNIVFATTLATPPQSIPTPPISGSGIV